MEFVSIRVNTLRGNLPIPFDAYIQIAGKHIHYCRKGDSFEGARLNRLKEKKLKKLYILKEHEDAYRSYLSESIDRAYDNAKNLPIDERAAVIQGAQQSTTEDLIENSTSEAFYRVAQTGTSRYIDFLLKNKDATKAVLGLTSSEENDISHHGISVATIAIGICETLKLNESHPFIMNQLALGCMIHDLEHHFSGLPLNLNPKQMTAENRANYEKHPLLGIERVRQTKHYDPLVLDIILKHEERSNGSGYPRQLQEKDIDPFVLIAGLANAYDRLVTFEKINRKQALKDVLLNDMGRFPLTNIQALQKFLKEKAMV